MTQSRFLSDFCSFLLQASHIVSHTLCFVSLKLSTLASRIVVYAYRPNYYYVIYRKLAVLRIRISYFDARWELHAFVLIRPWWCKLLPPTKEVTGRYVSVLSVRHSVHRGVHCDHYPLNTFRATPWIRHWNMGLCLIECLCGGCWSYWSCCQLCRRLLPPTHGTSPLSLLNRGRSKDTVTALITRAVVRGPLKGGVDSSSLPLPCRHLPRGMW